MLDTVFAVLTAAIIHAQNPTVLSQERYSLAQRYKQDPWVNTVFSDNILLTLSYMNGEVKEGGKINWDKVRKEGQYRLVLNPGETFAFHDSVFDKYEGKVKATTNAHFNFNQGFKSDGWLIGDGVCHLASFMYVAALEAGLSAEAPTNHDFMEIPGVSKEFGVSILYNPVNKSTSTAQNLYITNTKDTAIAFVFTHEENSLDVSVEEIN